MSDHTRATLEEQTHCEECGKVVKETHLIPDSGLKDMPMIGKVTESVILPTLGGVHKILTDDDPDLNGKGKVPMYQREIDGHLCREHWPDYVLANQELYKDEMVRRAKGMKGIPGYGKYVEELDEKVELQEPTA